MMANIECWLGSFVIFQGIWTSIAKKPFIFVIFQRGSRPPVPPLDPHKMILPFVSLKPLNDYFGKWIKTLIK